MNNQYGGKSAMYHGCNIVILSILWLCPKNSFYPKIQAELSFLSWEIWEINTEKLGKNIGYQGKINRKYNVLKLLKNNSTNSKWYYRQVFVK